LGGLGSDFPLPIARWRIPAVFSEGFAAWLETVCPFSVEIRKGFEWPPGAGEEELYLATESGPPLRVESECVSGWCQPIRGVRSGLRVLCCGVLGANFRGHALGELTVMGEDVRRDSTTRIEAVTPSRNIRSPRRWFVGMPRRQSGLGPYANSLAYFGKIAPRMLSCGVPEGGRLIGPFANPHRQDRKPGAALRIFTEEEGLERKSTLRRGNPAWE